MNREISQKCRWNEKDMNFAYCNVQQQQLSINGRSRRGLEKTAKTEFWKHDTRPEAGNEDGVWSMIVCDKCGKTVMYVTLLWFSNFIDGLLLSEHADSITPPTLNLSPQTQMAMRRKLQQWESEWRIVHLNIIIVLWTLWRDHCHCHCESVIVTCNMM